MGTAITGHSIQIYGNSQDGDPELARITLFENGTPSSFIVFLRPEADSREDTLDGEQITMHLPVEMFGHVIHLLESRKLHTIDFKRNRGVLATEHPA